jgi:hypothetical protein
VSVPDLTHLEGTAIKVTLARKPVKILGTYLSPSRPLVEADLTSCFVGSLPVLLTATWTLNILTGTHGWAREGENPTWLYLSHLWTGHTNHNPYKSSHTPHYLDIVLTKKLPSLLHMTYVLCTELWPPPCTHWHGMSLILSAPTSSFWRKAHCLAKLQNHKVDKFPFNPELHDKMAIDRWAENFSGAVLKALTVLAASSVRLRGNPPSERVEGWSVECDTRIPRSRRPTAVKNDQMCDESSYAVCASHLGGNRPLRPWNSRSLIRQTGDSVLADNRSFGLGSYWNGWSGAEVLLPYPASELMLTNPARLRENQGSQGRQWSGTKRCPEEGLEASSPASGIPPRPDCQCGSPPHHFLTALKDARVTSILKPGKDPVLLSSYRPISLLDTNYLKRFY